MESHISQRISQFLGCTFRIDPTLELWFTGKPVDHKAFQERRFMSAKPSSLRITIKLVAAADKHMVRCHRMFRE
jgi:hypothetical protein